MFPSSKQGAFLSMKALEWVDADNQCCPSEDASLRVNEDHSFVEGQVSKRSLKTVFHLDKGRLGGSVGVAKAQLRFRGLLRLLP